jgi:peptidoglycan hydrolase-like protein with peptidoglycan-binding domain
VADPIIKIGSKGAAVKKAQQALIDRYYLWDGTADGVFGPVTRKNVISPDFSVVRGCVKAGLRGNAFLVWETGCVEQPESCNRKACPW